jgi:hypothetical protein
LDVRCARAERVFRPGQPTPKVGRVVQAGHQVVVNRRNVDLCGFSPLDDGVERPLLAVMLQRKHAPDVVHVEDKISHIPSGLVVMP